jgi:LPXTG-site transpeptidase (sortase) family protein
MKSKSKKRRSPELPGSRVTLHFKRHVLPPLIGLTVVFLVIGFFDSKLISVHVAHYKQARQPKMSVPSLAADKTGPPRLIISSINVDVPVTFETRDSNTIFQHDLELGTVHYPGTALPGVEGNTVIFGQSGDQWWARGNYKFVFTLLDKLKIGDNIILDYQGSRYTYKVYDYTVVSASDLTPLNQSSSHVLTLITPTPIATGTNRLIIRASQSEPEVGNDFTFDKAASLPSGALKTLPGNNGSFFYELRRRL